MFACSWLSSLLLSNPSSEHKACSDIGVGEAGSWEGVRRICLLWSVCSTFLPHHQEILEKKTQWLSLSRWFLKLLLSYTQRTRGVNTFRNSPAKMEGWGLSNMQQMQQLKSPGDCWSEGAVTCYLKEGKYWLRAAALRRSSSTRTRRDQKIIFVSVFLISHLMKNNYNGLILLNILNLSSQSQNPSGTLLLLFSCKKVTSEQIVSPSELSVSRNSHLHPNQGLLLCGTVSLMLIYIFGYLEAEQNLKLVPQDVLIGKRLWKKGWHIMNLIILLV